LFPTAVPVKKAAPRPVQSFSIRLVAGAEQLTLVAERTTAGWRTCAVHRANKKNSRGATAEHPTIEAARAALEAQARVAEKAGWQQPASRRAGFARKPDAFTALPKPGASTKK